MLLFLGEGGCTWGKFVALNANVGETNIAVLGREEDNLQRGASAELRANCSQQVRTSSS